MRYSLLGLLLVALFSESATAAPRKWKDATGKHTTEAEFVELDGATVRLKRTDGKEVSIPLERLAALDQMFAIRESQVRAATLPVLSAKGKELSGQLVKDVKAAADPYSLKAKLEFEDFESGLAPALEALLKRGEELVALEGRRNAVAPALTELLRDGSPAVRAVAAKGAEDFGDAAVSAAPALIACLDDKMELVREVAGRALSHFGQASDGAVLALVAALETGPLGPGKKVTQLLVSAGNQGAGPNVELAVPRLAALLLDSKQDRQRRVLAAYALCGVLSIYRHDRGFDHRLRLAGYNEEVQQLLQQQSADRAKLITRTTAPLAAALPAMDDPELAALTFTLVAIYAPDDLGKVSPEKLVNLIEKLEDVEFDQELMFNIDSPLDILQSMMHQGNLAFQLSTQQSLKMLTSENERLRQFGQSQLLRNPRQTRKILPEIAALVRDGKSSEVRVASLSVLQRAATVSSDDLSELPVISIRAKSALRDPSLEVAGKSVAGPAALAAAIAEYKLPKPPEGAFDIEKAFKEAALADDNELRYMALEGLANRRTDSAKKILQDLSRTALKEETREMAQHLLEEARRPGFDLEGRERGDDSPFEPGKKKERRSLVAELTLDADLRMGPLIGLLVAVMETDVRGIRIVPVSKEGKRLAAIDLVPPDPPRNPEHMGAPYLQLKLGDHVASGQMPLEIKDQRHEHLWRKVPSVEALQFLLNWQIGPERRQPEFYEERLGFPGGGRLPVGAGALPYLISLTAAPGATMGDCVQVLEAIGVSEERGRRVDLVQWIRLTSGERTTPIWYMKIGDPPGNHAPP